MTPSQTACQQTARAWGLTCTWCVRLFGRLALRALLTRYPTQPNPFLDYVPPNLISLFITDSGCHCPSYVYRLLTEYYSPEDVL